MKYLVTMVLFDQHRLWHYFNGEHFICITVNQFVTLCKSTLPIKKHMVISSSIIDHNQHAIKCHATS